MTNKSLLTILFIAACASACAGQNGHHVSNTRQLHRAGLPVNDSLWVGEAEESPKHDMELQASRAQRDDLWMSQSYGAPETPELQVYRPRLDRALNPITPRQLASGTESQRLAF